MSTAVAVEVSNTVPPVVSSVQEIPLRNIQESKTNPRRQFDEAKLAELADFVPGTKSALSSITRYVSPGRCTCEAARGARFVSNIEPRIILVSARVTNGESMMTLNSWRSRT